MGPNFWESDLQTRVPVLVTISYSLSAAAMLIKKRRDMTGINGDFGRCGGKSAYLLEGCASENHHTTSLLKWAWAWLIFLSHGTIWGLPVLKPINIH